jgi:hypothetical protein
MIAKQCEPIHLCNEICVVCSLQNISDGKFALKNFSYFVTLNSQVPLSNSICVKLGLLFMQLYFLLCSFIFMQLTFYAALFLLFMQLFMQPPPWPGIYFSSLPGVDIHSE